MTLGAYVGPCAHFVPAGEFCQYRHGTGPKNASPASPMEELREQAAKIVRELREQINGPWAEEPAVVAMEEAAEFISRAIPLPAPVALPQAGEVDMPQPAFDALKRMMEADSEYAWGWHCNLAMPIMDSIGCSHEDANKAAAYLMQWIWGVDTSKDARAPTPTETPTAAAPDDGLMGWGETIESMIAWGDETFGPCEPSRAVSRAHEEWLEMVEEVPGTMQHAIEAADVIICLLRIPLIREAINTKMAKNRARKWKIMGDGTGYHIKEAALQPEKTNG